MLNASDCRRYEAFGDERRFDGGERVAASGPLNVKPRCAKMSAAAEDAGAAAGHVDALRSSAG